MFGVKPKTSQDSQQADEFGAIVCSLTQHDPSLSKDLRRGIDADVGRRGNQLLVSAELSFSVVNSANEKTGMPECG